AVGGLTLSATGNIDSITAQSWGGGSIVASSLGSFTLKGLKNQDPGDCSAVFVLSGAGLGAGKKTLNTVSIAGQVHNSWTVFGNSGSWTVTGGAAGWNFSTNNPSFITSLTMGAVIGSSISFNGEIGSLKVNSWASSSIEATQIDSLATTGD